MSYTPVIFVVLGMVATAAAQSSYGVVGESLARRNVVCQKLCEPLFLSTIQGKTDTDPGESSNMGIPSVYSGKDITIWCTAMQVLKRCMQKCRYNGYVNSEFLCENPDHVEMWQQAAPCYKKASAQLTKCELLCGKTMSGLVDAAQIGESEQRSMCKTAECLQKCRHGPLEAMCPETPQAQQLSGQYSAWQFTQSKGMFQKKGRFFPSECEPLMVPPPPPTTTTTTTTPEPTTAPEATQPPTQAAPKATPKATTTKKPDYGALAEQEAKQQAQEAQEALETAKKEAAEAEEAAKRALDQAMKKAEEAEKAAEAAQEKVAQAQEQANKAAETAKQVQDLGKETAEQAMENGKSVVTGGSEDGQ